MKTKFTFAVVGCGGRLRGVLGNLFKELNQPICVRVYDTDPASIEAAKKEWAAEVVACASWQEALDAKEVGWAFVGSWNCFHRDQVIEAFRAGKNVFAEKPLAITLDDCLAIREAWRTSGKQFFFGLVLRYSKFYQRVFAESRREKLGRLISFEFNETLGFNHGGYIHGNWRRYRKNAGSHLLEKCCHDMDIAQWMVGSLPLRVASFGGLNFFRPENRPWAETLGPDAYRAWPYPNPQRSDPFSGDQDIVDNQVVILEYANGARATFHTNCDAAIPERRLYLLGAHGAVRANAVTGSLEIQQIGFNTQLENVDLKIRDGHAGGDEVMARHLAATIVEGKAPIAGMEEALRSAVICFGIDQALDEKRVVDLRPLWHCAGIIPETE